MLIKTTIVLLTLAVAVMAFPGGWRWTDKSADQILWASLAARQPSAPATFDSEVIFQRWSDANPAKAFQLQSFGGYLSDYKDFDGFRLPTRVEAGNFVGIDDYFAFFKVNVTSVRFPAGNGD